RNAEILDALGFYFGEVWPHALEVTGDVDRNVPGLMSIQVVQLDGAELFDPDRVGARGGGLEIGAVAVKNFRDLLSFGVVGEEADGTVAIGKKINRVANPH